MIRALTAHAPSIFDTPGVWASPGISRATTIPAPTIAAGGYSTAAYMQVSDPAAEPGEHAESGRTYRTGGAPTLQNDLYKSTFRIYIRLFAECAASSHEVAHERDSNALLSPTTTETRGGN